MEKGDSLLEEGLTILEKAYPKKNPNDKGVSVKISVRTVDRDMMTRPPYLRNAEI